MVVVVVAEDSAVVAEDPAVVDAADRYRVINKGEVCTVSPYLYWPRQACS